MSSTRPYRSRLREQQAAQTRARILRAARTRFAEQGYAVTTIAQIARDAEVSPQTVYSAFATKPGLALALVDHTNAESGAAELAQDVAAAQTAEDILQASVHLVCVLHERIGDFIRVMLEAAQVEPELAPVLEAGRASHAEPQRGIAARLQEMGALREDLDVESAATLLTVWTSPEAVERLVHERHWSYQQVEERLPPTLVRALCRTEDHGRV